MTVEYINSIMLLLDVFKYKKSIIHQNYYTAFSYKLQQKTLKKYDL